MSPRSNPQYISLGNLTADNRVSLILIDYSNGRRLKIYAHAQAKDLDTDPTLVGRLAVPGYKAKPERALLLQLEAFDWNCPQHITARFSATDLESALLPVRQRLERLEIENRMLRQKLAHPNGE